MYLSFPTSWWDVKEPPSPVRPSLEIRQARLAQRLLPTFSSPNIKWIKAVYLPTNEIVGIAGWTLPGAPLHNHFRRDAFTYYGWQEKLGWSDAYLAELFEHVDDEKWSQNFAKDDKTRRAVLGDEEHWWLAPLLTWPEWQGRGVGSRLLDWAIEQADAKEEKMYLESAPTARAVYMNRGWKPVGDWHFLRMPKGSGESERVREWEEKVKEKRRMEEEAEKGEKEKDGVTEVEVGP